MVYEETKVLISCMVTLQLICVFVFAYAKSGFLINGLIRFIFFFYLGQHTLKQKEKEQHAAHASEPEKREPIPRHKPTKPHTAPSLGPAPLSQTRCTNSAPLVRMTPKAQPNIQRGWTSRVRHEPYPDTCARQKADSLNSSSNLKKTIKIEVNDDDNDKSNTEIEVNRIGNDKTKFVIHSNSDSLSNLASETSTKDTGGANEISQSLVGDNSSESSGATTLVDESLQIETPTTCTMDTSVNENGNTQGSGILDSMNIKVETNTEYDSDWEISGAEPGNISQNTAANDASHPRNTGKTVMQQTSGNKSLDLIDDFINAPIYIPSP